MNEYERKFQVARNELMQAGIWLRNAPIPFKLRVMRSLGLKPRPFNYCAYWQLLIGPGLLAALGSAGYHFASERLWPNKERPLMQLVEESVMLGVVVGGVITIRLFKVVLKTARKSGLSNWQSLQLYAKLKQMTGPRRTKPQSALQESCGASVFRQRMT